MARSESIAIDLYSVFEIEKVPRHPGIYAWFLRKPIQPPITPEKVARRLRDDLELTRTHIELESINTEFRSFWTGKLSLELNNDLNEKYQTILQGLDKELLDATVLHFNNIMSHLPPLLYVGKANDLRTRINNHLTNIQRLSQGQGLEFADPDAREFPERVISYKIPIDYLRFTFFESPMNNNPVSLKANEFVEQLVNQNLRPRLGKR